MDHVRRFVPRDVEVLHSLLRGRNERRALLEIWIYSFPSPTRVAKSLPGIVISSRATIVHHAVDDGATTQYIGDTNLPCLVVEEWLRLRHVVGPQQGLVQSAGRAIWQSLLERQVVSTSLNHENGCCGEALSMVRKVWIYRWLTLLVLGQSIGYDEASHSATNDDIIVCVGCPLLYELTAWKTGSQSQQGSNGNKGSHVGTALTHE